MKTIVITGASSGIGMETACVLCKKGHQIIAVGHSMENCERANKRILTEAPDAKIVWFAADLMQQREVIDISL